jgi:hypothetical protein
MFIDKLKSPLFSALMAVVFILILGLTAIGLEKPTGSIQGRVSLEEAGFGLHTYDIRNNKVYVLAVGPRGGNLIERGAWVQPDGTFRLTQLPVGEYSLQVRATGYGTASRESVFVDEAKVNQLEQPVTLAILEPSVNIASNNRVFTTRETPSFWLNATGSTQASVKIYRKDILQLIRENAGEGDNLEFSTDLSLYKPYKAKQGKLFAQDQPIQTLTRKLSQDHEDWSRADFKLNRPLPAGEYVALAEVSNLKGQKDWNILWFSVSDLGLIVKQAPEKTVVRAIDLNTLKPLSDVDIRMLDRQNPAINTNLGKTNQNGFVEFPVPENRRKESGNYNLLAFGTIGKNRAFGGIDYWNYNNNGYETYFYTERPVYRLGQTVYYKAILRQRSENGLINPKAGLSVQATIEDPDNNKLWEGRLLTNGYGSISGTWQIPADGKTGAYQLTLNYPDGSTSYQRFEVAQYRKPEYQVEVLPLEQRIVAGSKGKARIRATYYFGAPVANARIKYSVYAASDWSSRYRLMPRPAYYGYYDDWQDDADYYEDTSYAGDYISEGYAQTDETGEAVIEYDTRAPEMPDAESPYSGDTEDKRYTIQAEVTDLSRMAVVSSGLQSVTAGNFALFVNPTHDVTRAGDPVQATVTAVTYEGKPVAGKTVSVSLLRWMYDRAKGEYRGIETLKTEEITTDSQGQATVTLPTTNRFFTDGYYVTAKTQDEQGHTVYDQESVWIASENYPYVREGLTAQRESFAVKTDKSVYQPGETAKIMITAPLNGREGAQAIVSIEGAKLHEYRVVPMDATAKMVEIPLKADYAPNVYVTATLVGPKHQFYNQESILKVSPEAHFLNISIATDKAKYKPGEMATYTIKALYPDGKPAKDTELSMAVVDESIYSIRPDPAKDIRKFFYDKLYNAVVTLSSFPEEYSGGPDKTEPRVRKDFRDMAAWQPNLVTDANGIVKTKVKLPDNLTTWRATVRGINSQTDVGSAVSKVVATQDLIVRLALPRFFTQYDRGNLTAIVHNYTEKAQQITLTLNASPQFDTREVLVQRLTVEPDQAKRFVWPVEILQPGQGLVSVKAVGQTEGDAMELKVPINPLGVEITSAAGGILKGDPASVRIPLNTPPGISPALAKVFLSLAPSSIGPVLGNFDTLIDYPYSCTEQTMSRLFPAAIARKLNQSLGVPMTEAQTKRFQEVQAKALTRLKEYHNADGGWGWWRYDDSNPYLSAYVMEGLHLLQEAGYPVNDDEIGYQWQKDGIAFLEKASVNLSKQLQDPKSADEEWTKTDRLIDLSYLQYVLGLYERKPAKQARAYLLSQLQKAPPEALAFQVLAFKEAKDESAARQAYQALNRLADPADQMLNWDHTPHLQRVLSLKRTDYTYRFTGTEATAMALRATVAMENAKTDPAAEERLEAIERWLILQHGASGSIDGGWDNTKTTAQVLRAMMEKAIALGKPQDTQLAVLSNLWNETLRLTSADVYAPERTAQTTLSTIPNQVIELSKQGMGRLYYSSLLSYMLPLKPGVMVPQKPLPEGLRIRRAFYRMQAEPVGPTGTMRFKTHVLSDGTVRAGETVLMKVTVESPVALPYVIVDTALPSGGEVVSNDPREANMEGSAESDSSETDGFSGDWGNWWWTHQDILDDRVIMFASSVPAGKSGFYALVRMEMPGTFQMNPVKLEGMYSKRIRAYSPVDQLKVIE